MRQGASTTSPFSPLGRRKPVRIVHRLDRVENSDRPVHQSSRAWIVVAGLAPAPFVAALVLDSGSAALVITVVVSALILVAAALLWAIGRNRIQQREYEDRLAVWAAERATEKERLRIARDLHDLSSHGLGLITVRAAAAGFLEGPEADVERQRAMEDIERISRRTTSELRDMLLLLRSPGDTEAPLRPVDSLAALPGIIEEAERGGLIVESHIENVDVENPADHRLSQSVQLAMCTVVREALTNALRHAGPTSVHLTMSLGPGSVSILVDDDGPLPGWKPEPGAGHGLTGLRERVEAHGGSFVAGPTGRGFRLRASIPVEAM